MRYSNDKTLALATEIGRTDCLKDLNQMISHEGFTGALPFFGNSEIVLDMDCVEGKLASYEKRIPNKSMDSAFVISNGKTEILLVEFRFNYRNMKNLDKRELFGKVSGSRNALISSTLNIQDNYYFVFDNNLKEQAKRRFRNMVPSMPTHYIATDLIDLKALFF